VNAMVQQAIARSISEYPFKVSDTEANTWTTSGQGTTVSGTTFAVDVAVSQSGVNATITKNYLVPNFWQTLSELLIASVNHININGKTLRLAKPITANITYRDNVFFCQNEELGIVTMSAKLDDCIKEFQDEILFVWNEYGKEDDNRLTNGAKKLKEKISQYISK